MVICRLHENTKKPVCHVEEPEHDEFYTSMLDELPWSVRQLPHTRWGILRISRISKQPNLSSRYAKLICIRECVIATGMITMYQASN